MEVQRVAKAGAVLDEDDAQFLLMFHLPVFPRESACR